MIESVITEAKKLLNDKVIATLKEQGPKVALQKLYILLPSPVRLFVKEEAFVKFCLTHQDKIFGKSSQVKPVKKIVKKASTVAVKKTTTTKTVAKKPTEKKAVAKKK